MCWSTIRPSVSVRTTHGQVDGRAVQVTVFAPEAEVEAGPDPGPVRLRRDLGVGDEAEGGVAQIGVEHAPAAGGSRRRGSRRRGCRTSR